MLVVFAFSHHRHSSEPVSEFVLSLSLESRIHTRENRECCVAFKSLAESEVAGAYALSLCIYAGGFDALVHIGVVIHVGEGHIFVRSRGDIAHGCSVFASNFASVVHVHESEVVEHATSDTAYITLTCHLTHIVAVVHLAASVAPETTCHAILVRLGCGRGYITEVVAADDSARAKA